MRPNPSLHRTFNSRLRRLLPAGELKRYEKWQDIATLYRAARAACDCGLS